MQRIFCSHSLIEVTQLKNALENARIACFIRNEMSTGLIGEVPVTEATPELWIEQDSDLEEALRIKRDWQAPAAVAGPNWVCPNCGETSEPQYDSCWKCGKTRS